jgi:hypothetical protein
MMIASWELQRGSRQFTAWKLLRARWWPQCIVNSQAKNHHLTIKNCGFLENKWKTDQGRAEPKRPWLVRRPDLRLINPCIRPAFG